MLPQAIGAPFEFVIQPLATLALNQALASTLLVDDNDAKLRINFPLAVPITAGRTHFDFGRKNQLFSHGFGKVGIGKHES